MTVVDLEMQILPGAGSQLFVHAKIGTHNVRLLVDSGASASAICQTWLDKKFPTLLRRSIGAQTLGIHGASEEMASTMFVQLPKLQIGDLVFGEFEYSTICLDEINAAYRYIRIREINGLMGGNLLQATNAIISYPELKLFLSPDF